MSTKIGPGNQCDILHPIMGADNCCICALREQHACDEASLKRKQEQIDRDEATIGSLQNKLAAFERGDVKRVWPRAQCAKCGLIMRAKVLYEDGAASALEVEPCEHCREKANEDEATIAELRGKLKAAEEVIRARNVIANEQEERIAALEQRLSALDDPVAPPAPEKPQSEREDEALDALVVMACRGKMEEEKSSPEKPPLIPEHELTPKWMFQCSMCGGGLGGTMLDPDCDGSITMLIEPCKKCGKSASEKRCDCPIAAEERCIYCARRLCKYPDVQHPALEKPLTALTPEEERERWSLWTTQFTRGNALTEEGKKRLDELNAKLEGKPAPEKPKSEYRDLTPEEAQKASYGEMPPVDGVTILKQAPEKPQEPTSLPQEGPTCLNCGINGLVRGQHTLAAKLDALAAAFELWANTGKLLNHGYAPGDDPRVATKSDVAALAAKVADVLRVLGAEQPGMTISEAVGRLAAKVEGISGGLLLNSDYNSAMFKKLTEISGKVEQLRMPVLTQPIMPPPMQPHDPYKSPFTCSVEPKHE